MNLKSIVVVVAAAMMLLSDADMHQAQTRSRNRQPVARPTPQSVTTQTAITKDGNTVLLRSDGTWEYYYAPPVAPTSRTQVAREGTLSLEPGLVFRSGDMKPVAPTIFYLLDEYPGQILKEAGIKPDNRSDGMNYDDAVNLSRALGLAMAFPTHSGEQELLAAAMAAIKPYIVQTTTADFVGKAQFAAVPIGSYYLMGGAQTPKGMIFWNMSVDMKAGQNSIALDQQYSVYGR